MTILARRPAARKPAPLTRHHERALTPAQHNTVDLFTAMGAEGRRRAVALIAAELAAGRIVPTSRAFVDAEAAQIAAELAAELATNPAGWADAEVSALTLPTPPEHKLTDELQWALEALAEDPLTVTFDCRPSAAVIREAAEAAAAVLMVLLRANRHPRRQTASA